jgi:hypothetical protein
MKDKVFYFTLLLIKTISVRAKLILNGVFILITIVLIQDTLSAQTTARLLTTVFSTGIYLYALIGNLFLFSIEEETQLSRTEIVFFLLLAVLSSALMFYCFSQILILAIVLAIVINFLIIRGIQKL